MKKKVKITRMPDNVPGKRTGDQHNYAIYRPDYVKDSYEDEPSYRNNINSSVFPEGTANVEAEGGETSYADYDGDGFPELMNITGKKHAPSGSNRKGGEDIFVPEGGFIYSDTPKMRVKGDVLEAFGKSGKSKKGYTPAQLSKQYKMNDYKDNLKKAEKSQDPYSKASNEQNVENGINKLGQLALVQESMKGYPDGLPNVAMPYLETIMPQEVNNGNEEGIQHAEFGGLIKAKNGLTDPNDPKVFNPLDIVPWLTSNTKVGHTTDTGKDSRFKPEESKDYIPNWERDIPGIKQMSNKDAQNAIYDYMLENDPDAIRNMWGEWGLNNKAKGNPSTAKLDVNNLSYADLKRLKEEYSDGFFGGRQLNKRPNKTRGVPDQFGTPHTSKMVDPTTPITSGLTPNFPTLTTSNPNVEQTPLQYPDNPDAPIEPYFWDKMAMFNAATRPIDHIRPQLFSPNTSIGSPSFVDNRAQIQNMRGVAAQNANVIENTSNGQTARANLLANQSKLFDPINQSFENMNNQNVGISNQWTQYRDQAQNQDSLSKLQALDRFKRENDMFRSNLSKEKQMKLADTTMAGQNMTNNMIGQIAFRERYPEYNFNMGTPLPSMSFIPGQGPITGVGNEGSAQPDFQKQVNELAKQPGWDIGKALEYVKWANDKKVQTYKNQSPVASQTTLYGPK